MKRILLKRLSAKFSRLVTDYMKSNDLTIKAIADEVGLNRSHLSHLINQTPHRTISAYYIRPFLMKGVFSVDQIYDNTPESEKEADFWKDMRIYENPQIRKRIREMQKKAHEKGIPFLEYLDKLLDVV